MRIGSLFSGIGGLELGLERAGVGHVAWQVEQDAFCREVLARHWPGVDRAVQDVTTAGAHNLGHVDLICGGFPCQDVSGAGKGAGLAGSRSGLWFEFARIVGELQPRWVVVENVASGAKRWVDAVVAGLGELGYEALPIPLSAGDVGAPHRRARVFIVARRVSDTQRVELRNESGRGSGTCGSEAAESADVGAQLADAGREAGRSGARQPLSGDSGETLCGWAPELGRRRKDLADTDSCRWQPRSVQGSSQAGTKRAWSSASRSSYDVADSNGQRREGERRGRVLDGQWAAQRHDADGRCGAPTMWPPRLDDREGWARWIAEGGPQPAVCRGSDGLPAGLARSEWKARLKALGNAVVPQCAEVIGHVILELEMGTAT